MLSKLKALISGAPTKSGANTIALSAVPVAPEILALLADAAKCVEAGNSEQAEVFYRQVLVAAPKNVEANAGLGEILKGKGAFAESEVCARNAVGQAPDSGELHFLLGTILHAQNGLDDAIAQYQQALKLDASLVAVYANLAFAYFQRGQNAYAKQTLSQGLAAKPNAAELHFLRGNFFMQEGDATSALSCFDRALSIMPEVAAWHFNRAIALTALNRGDDAASAYEEAIRIQPDYVDAWNNLGTLQLALRQNEKALASFERALRLAPENADALSNRGLSLRSLGRADEALESVHDALRQNPANAAALNNRGMALQDLGRREEALDSYAKALQLEPNYAEARLNESLCLLQMGDFSRGWQHYEGRKHSPYLLESWRKSGRPIWLGNEPLRGKTILLQAEQGLGDTIQFCRYAKLVAARGATVFLEVQPAVVPILRDQDGIEKLFARGEEIPAFDFHCPLMSLPLALGTQLDSIPAEVPYLRADPVYLEKWKAKLGERTRPRVGLVWAGNADFPNDSRRSIPLAAFSSFASTQFQIFSLQKDLRPADQAELEKRPDIAQINNDIRDFADTAAIIELLDAVVSVDTAVAHLAGALGKPLWLLLPDNADFRWLLDREDSPWYPSAKLVRQRRESSWQGAIGRVLADIESTLNSKKS